MQLQLPCLHIMSAVFLITYCRKARRLQYGRREGMTDLSLGHKVAYFLPRIPSSVFSEFP